MFERDYTIRDKQGRTYRVIFRKDKRLKKTTRYQLRKDDEILVRVPYRLSRRYYSEILRHLEDELEKLTRRKTGRTDADLQKRAEKINRKYFRGKIRWQAIRWVNNMNSRLGSCTSGGTTDGHIRISAKIAGFPDWVLDYVIAHEMTHRLYPDHSKAFWETLKTAYPRADEARAFIKGYFFAKGETLEDE